MQWARASGCGPSWVRRCPRRAARAIADRLCRACVELLQVDGAWISLTLDGVQRGTLGASSRTSRYLDELQFTYGEGPCLDAVAEGRPVLVADLAGVQDRWPVYAGAVLQVGVSAVFALPVRLSAQPVGALDCTATGADRCHPTLWPLGCWPPSWPRCRCWT